MCCGSSRAARWISSRSTPPRKGTGTSSAASKQAPCCSARSRARSTPCSAGPPRTACCAVSRCANCPATSTGSTATPGRSRNTARRAMATTPRTAARARRPPRWSTPSHWAPPAAWACSSRHRSTAAPATRRWPTTTSCGCRSRPAPCSTAPPTARRRPAICWWTPSCGSRWSISSTGCCPPSTAGSSSWSAPTRTVRRPVSRRAKPSASAPTRRWWHPSAGPGGAVPRRTGPATTPPSRSAARSPRRPVSRSPSHRRAAPSTTGSPRSNGSRSARGSGPARSGSRGPGGGPTPGPWWAIAPSPVRRWRCCGAVAGTRRSTRSPGCGCGSARTTPTNSNRAPSCSTARCRNVP